MHHKFKSPSPAPLRLSCLIVSVFLVLAAEGKLLRPPPRPPRSTPHPPPAPRHPPPRPFPPLPPKPPSSPALKLGIVSILVSSSKANSLLNCTSPSLLKALKLTLKQQGVNNQMFSEPACMQGDDFTGVSLDILFLTQDASEKFTQGLYRGGAARLLKNLKMGCGQDSALLLWDVQSNRISRWACHLFLPPSYPSPPPSSRPAGGAPIVEVIGGDTIPTIFYSLPGLCCSPTAVNKLNN